MSSRRPVGQPGTVGFSKSEKTPLIEKIKSSPKVVHLPNARRHPPVHPFDRERGTDTGGLIRAKELLMGHANDKHVTAYYGVAPSILRRLIEIWTHHTSPLFSIDRYTFVDAGAGKGRAMLLAAESPFREVIGVELNPALAATARRNLEIVTTADHADPELRPALLSPMRVIEGDILSFPFAGTPTLLHLFHPFEAPVLRRLLRNLEARFSNYTDALDIMYVNAELAPILNVHPAFHRVWQGSVLMSTEDHVADLREIAEQHDYGSTGDEQCAIYRYRGRPPETREAQPKALFKPTKDAPRTWPQDA